jgi:hypothetical protein
LVEHDENNNLVAVYIPAVGVPTSYDYYQSKDFVNLLNNKNLKIYLLYDSTLLQEDWVEHLKWLNSGLDVKTIKKDDFEKWLKQK